LVPASLHPRCASAIQSLRIQNVTPRRQFGSRILTGHNFANAGVVSDFLGPGYLALALRRIRHVRSGIRLFSNRPATTHRRHSRRLPSAARVERSQLGVRPDYGKRRRRPDARQSRDMASPARSGAYAASLRDTNSVKSRTHFVLRVSPCVRSHTVRSSSPLTESAGGKMLSYVARASRMRRARSRSGFEMNRMTSPILAPNLYACGRPY
jgi:hypothetical protein